MKETIKLDDGTVLKIYETEIENSFEVEWIQDGELLDSGRFTKDTIDEYKNNWEAFVDEYFYVM